MLTGRVGADPDLLALSARRRGNEVGQAPAPIRDAKSEHVRSRWPSGVRETPVGNMGDRGRRFIHCDGPHKAAVEGRFTFEARALRSSQ
jgi:hypothetical protein